MPGRVAGDRRCVLHRLGLRQGWWAEGCGDRSRRGRRELGGVGAAGVGERSHIVACAERNCFALVGVRWELNVRRVPAQRRRLLQRGWNDNRGRCGRVRSPACWWRWELCRVGASGVGERRNLEPGCLGGGSLGDVRIALPPTALHLTTLPRQSDSTTGGAGRAAGGSGARGSTTAR